MAAVFSVWDMYGIVLGLGLGLGIVVGIGFKRSVVCPKQHNASGAYEPGEKAEVDFWAISIVVG